MLLHDYLEHFAVETPDHPFAEMGDRSVSYSQANELANRFANTLLQGGLTKGERFAYISKNSIDMVIMFYGASKAGVIPVPINYRLAAQEFAYIINDAACRLVFAEAEFCPALDSAQTELDSGTTFVCLDGTASGEHWIGFTDWLTAAAGTPVTDVAESDQLYQMYTSGTTGLPKGAMLSHYAVSSNLAMASVFLGFGVGAERNLIVAPLYHAAAGVTAMAIIACGSTLLIHREFDPVAVVHSLEHEGVTSVTLVPAMIQACMVAVPDLGQRSFPALHRISYGASPIALDTLRAAMASFRCDFSQAFGMTELTCIATGMSPAIHRRALAGEPGLLLSAGRALLGTQVRIADADDQELPRGSIGEIQVRGPQVMMGYWNKPEATAQTLRGGWMHTGDAAYMDAEGFIYIQDRIKDMIVSGGENIYPAEIESALFQHPAVADAAVIGIPSEKWGESVLAFIVLKAGQALDAEELMEFCRPRLAGYKIPRQVEFIEQIPRNASGKVLKKDLREPYWKDVERRVN